MAEYIKREDAVETLEHLLFETAFNNCGVDDEYAHVCADIASNRIEGYVSAVPAADVVEVVRCRDCKYWNPKVGEIITIKDKRKKECTRLSIRDNIDAYPFLTDENFYCSCGERMVDNA